MPLIDLKSNEISVIMPVTVNNQVEDTSPVNRQNMLWIYISWKHMSKVENIGEIQNMCHVSWNCSE